MPASYPDEPGNPVIARHPAPSWFDSGWRHALAALKSVAEESSKPKISR